MGERHRIILAGFDLRTNEMGVSVVHRGGGGSDSQYRRRREGRPRYTPPTGRWGGRSKAKGRKNVMFGGKYRETEIRYNLITEFGW